MKDEEPKQIIYLSQSDTAQTESDWTAYRQARNEVNGLMKDPYH